MASKLENVCAVPLRTPNANSMPKLIAKTTENEIQNCETV